MSGPAASSWIQDIRSRLAEPRPRRLPDSEDRQAAVLVPLFVDAGQLWTVLTKRAETLSHHSGQIAFPGGSLDGDEDAWTAALREANEEVGLDSKRVLPLGDLDEARTPSGFRIVPCVGAVPFPLEVTDDSDEIDEVFSVPLRAFVDARLIEDRLVNLDGEEHLYRIYHIGGRQVWGLTARIVQNLLERLGFDQPQGA